MGRGAKFIVALGDINSRSIPGVKMEDFLKNWDC